MTKMKTTIKLAKECGIRVGNILVNVEVSHQLEAFSQAAKTDFASKRKLSGFRITHLDGSYELSFNNAEQNLHILPKETK